MVESDVTIRLGIEADMSGVAEQLKSLGGSVLYSSDTSADARGLANEANKATKTKSDWWEIAQQMQSMDTSSLEDDAKKNASLTKFLSQSFDKISDTLKKTMTMSFDVVESIYKELKKSSPLLQTLEQLFNLAMTLFFMPLGNKLAEVLLPAVVEMLDKVVSLWDEIGDGSLEQIFSEAFNKGIRILGETLVSMGNSLSEQGGLIGAIGRTLTTLGNFLQGPGLTVINLILNATTFIIENLKHIISAVIAFKVASIAMQLMTMYTIAASNSVAGWFGGGLAVAGVGTAVAAGAAFLTSEAVLSSQGLAEGGYVPAVDGGLQFTIAEGGEGEYVIPESKLSSYQSVQSLDSKLGTGSATASGGNTYNISINGITWEEAKSYIKDVVAEQISLSRLRSGF